MRMTYQCMRIPRNKSKYKKSSALKKFFFFNWMVVLVRVVVSNFMPSAFLIITSHLLVQSGRLDTGDICLKTRRISKAKETAAKCEAGLNRIFVFNGSCTQSPLRTCKSFIHTSKGDSQQEALGFPDVLLEGHYDISVRLWNL